MKSEGLGQAGFIALDRLANTLIPAFEAPACCERLFDQVQSQDERYLSAFFLAIGNTVVCQYLETALFVPEPRDYAVVTINGDVFD